MCVKALHRQRAAQFKMHCIMLLELFSFGHLTCCVAFLEYVVSFLSCVCSLLLGFS